VVTSPDLDLQPPARIAYTVREIPLLAPDGSPAVISEEE
jgi:hypothetical protein